jgi:hypothetical protein
MVLLASTFHIDIGITLGNTGRICAAVVGLMGVMLMNFPTALYVPPSLSLFFFLCAWLAW